ncbi:APC family permease [Nocardia sp. NPDC004604]|uniref:APC family permease n=1 Tax=Nocardia sp. NPDC004604 TaxID=3157013 RepID=UPI0033A9AB89
MKHSETGVTAGTQPASTELRSDVVGTTDLVFFVLSAAAPLTVMAGFAALGFLIAGQVAPAGYLIAGIVYVVFAVGFTAMSKHVRNSGAFYAYISRGIGPTIGAGSAMVAYLSYALGQIGFLAATGVFASEGIALLIGVSVPWQMTAVVLGSVVALLSYLKVDIGAKVLAVLLLTEVGVLFVLAIAVLIRGGHEGLSADSFNPAHLMTASIGALFAITFVVYIGFEQTAIYSEEARDAQRTVPRATYIAIVVLAVVYTFISWAILMAAGPSRLAALLAGDPAQLVFDLNTEYVGATMTSVMQVLIITSFFAGALALQNAGARYLFALGRDGVLPAWFSRTGARTKTPQSAGLVHTLVVVCTLIGFGLTSLDPYTQIVLWTNTPTLVGVMALEIAVCIAVIRYLRHAPGGETLWQRLIAPGLATILLVVVMALLMKNMPMLTGLGPVGNAIMLSPLAVGFAIGVGRALWLRTAAPDRYRRLSGNTETLPTAEVVR